MPAVVIAAPALVGVLHAEESVVFIPTELVALEHAHGAAASQNWKVSSAAVNEAAQQSHARS